MVYIDETRLAAYRNTIRDHKRELKFADAHEASLSRKPNGLSLEAEQVLSQVDESIFEDDEINHDDCEIQECFECYEEAVGRAEAAAEGMER